MRFMKNGYLRFLFPFLLLISISLYSQDSSNAIRFRNGNFIPGRTIAQGAFKKEALTKSLFADRYFVIIQFPEIPSAQQQQGLRKAGIVLDRYLPGKAWLASVPATFNFGAARNLDISSIDTLPAFYKLDAELIKF